MRILRLALPTLLLHLACPGGPADPGRPDEGGADDDDLADDDAGDDDDLAGDDDDLADDDDSAGDDGPCPPGMALVDPAPEPAFCIDRYEAALEVHAEGAWRPRTPYGELSGDEEVRAVSGPGLVPQSSISGTEAAAACSASGRRLCTDAEWLAACRGPEGFTYPYGDTHVEGACNDTYPGGHPVVDFFGTGEGIWDAEHMNDPGINQQPDTVEPGGAHPACVSAWGVYDLHGNLHEWTAAPGGSFRGGFYADASINGRGCGYVTTAHSMGYHDYSTGFRCCAEPLGKDPR